MGDLVFYPAHQIAQMIRERSVSAVEVFDAHLAQISQHNSKLNAICTLDEERACQRAKQADEALARGENWGYFEVLTKRDRLIAQIDQALEPCDVWLCPVAITPAFTHRAKGAAVEVDGRKVPHYLASGTYTMPFNLTGHPVVVIPIGQTQTGLPIGMQILGKRWKEMELLAIAEKAAPRGSIAQQLTQITGGFQHPPG